MKERWGFVCCLLWGDQNGCYFSSHTRRMTLAEEREGQSMEVGGKGDSGQLMDSGTAPALENGGTQDPWMYALEWASPCVVFWLCKRLCPISVHVMCVHVCVLYAQFSYVDKTLSLDATAPRTSQCAVEDMWSKLNPLLYFTSSFTTQIQT